VGGVCYIVIPRDKESPTTENMREIKSDEGGKGIDLELLKTAATEVTAAKVTTTEVTTPEATIPKAAIE